MHDIEDALNALEAVVRGNETKTNYSGLYYRPQAAHGDRFCIVGSALFYHAGVSLLELVAMGPLKIDHLYERDLCPLPLTLGAMIVYRAAQRTQGGLVGDDRSWATAFDKAVVAAGRVFDLMPGSVVASAQAELVTT